ncbi:MAG: hypothetical protein QOE04_2209, partial [Mycobacterium sp.]|nr:hypothetical protein [Mycobacterium sp.]
MKAIVRKVFSVFGGAVLGVAVVVAGCGTSTKPATQSTGTPTSSPPAVVTPVLATVVAAPVPVPATDGKVHLAYELQLTNAMGSDVTL